jgi:hypothetical protein
MADEMIPRFSAADMPKPVPEPGPGATAVPRLKPAGATTPAAKPAAKPAAGRGGTK